MKLDLAANDLYSLMDMLRSIIKHCLIISKEDKIKVIVRWSEVEKTRKLYYEA